MSKKAHNIFRVILAIQFLLIILLSCKKPAYEKIPDSRTVDGSVISGISEILGRPTNSSVTISILSDQKTDVYWELGTLPGVYTSKTEIYSIEKSIPLETDFINLSGNTLYYYRTRYRTGTSSLDFQAGPEHSFYTQRSSGSTFTFTVEADEHLYDKKGVRSIYKVCLENQAADNPDFMISLGDIFGNDHFPESITSAEIDQLHKQYLPFLGAICNSVPFFVCLGNHEGESGYLMKQNPPDNLAVNGTIWRKYYYPNPYPNGFYSGNTDIEPYGIGNPENYYSWTWGDALFVVLDVYRDKANNSLKPEKWDWTLGETQYKWLKNTLETSTSKYKMVFAHHIRGQGRGGVTNAKYYEWGGYDEDGITYSFTAMRPGWEKPIHKLFTENGVNIFFHGHDHVFSHEVLDGVTYQSVPMPSDSTYQIGILANGAAYTTDVVGGTGHLKVTVSPGGIKLDFVQAYLPDNTTGKTNRNVAFTYTIN
jgi:hypothetical protein